eukprot:2997483-Prymnesium_polylepis.1
MAGWRRRAGGVIRFDCARKIGFFRRNCLQIGSSLSRMSPFASRGRAAQQRTKMRSMKRKPFAVPRAQNSLSSFA